FRFAGGPVGGRPRGEAVIGDRGWLAPPRLRRLLGRPCRIRCLGRVQRGLEAVGRGGGPRGFGRLLRVPAAAGASPRRERSLVVRLTAGGRGRLRCLRLGGGGGDLRLLGGGGLAPGRRLRLRGGCWRRI